ncbi:hypothetical protein INS49_015681 [Diaporthe citri]|uniref:uncharacterized protein n=1 Tax=Diaporthe citri TaxID=83186 RepID=UPI001C807F53|nr:uncharacterized protein INS49_015681 [Diaporthe citri]KAG6356294.1 hypothetical protein INS49_015681 [Diaporthe citri]
MLEKKGCHLGSLPPYVVNATDSSDFQQTLAFAENNIMVIIKNNGHSGVARRTGFGSISIWTHNLKQTVFHEKFQPSSCTINSTWKGSQMAITVGAGVQDGELFKFAEKNNVVAVGGTNMDVGVVGWATGGGHGYLTGEFGMGADNILEATIVTPNGDLLTANACQNEDIYWAIRGGGGSTFSVIVNMTMKAFPIPKMTLMGLNLVANEGTSTKDWWKVVAKLHTLLPALQDQGVTGYYTIGGPPSSETVSLAGSLFLWNAPNGTALNITSSIQQLFTENAAAVNGDEDLFAEVLMQVGTQAAAPADGTPNPSMSGTMTIGHDPVDNALNPAWRKSVVHLITSTSWPDSLPHEHVSQIVNDVTYNKLNALRRLEPSTGAYLNEANAFESGWQWSFFGPNYGRLRTIKEKYDPEGLLWCPQCVGSEDWAQTEDGKLCKTYNVFATSQS